LRRCSGPPLLGFFVPTTFDSRCPVSATIGSTDRGRREFATPSPGSALGLRPLDRAHPAHPAHLAVLLVLQAPSTGLPLPLGGLSRADSCKVEFPRSCSSVVATPLSFRSRLPDHETSLGFALQSFPFPGSRAAFRRPSASLRVRRRPCLRREDSLAVRPVSTTRLVLASLAAPREEDTRSRHWTRERDFPAIVKTACPPCELPRTTTSTTDTENLRARRHAAVSPASKPCSPRESVHATDREVPRACARRSPRPTGPVLSWVLPLQSFLRHDLGFGRLHEHPAAKPSYRESHSPVPDD